MNQEEIQKRIDEILSDDRMLQKTANVFSNTPLAFIQYGLTTELHTLQRVINQPLTDINKLRGEK